MSTDYTTELQRDSIITRLHMCANAFLDNSSPIRAAYIGGPAGCGKTFLVKKAFQNPEWDCVLYDCAIIKAKDLVREISNTMLANTTVLSLMQRTSVKQVVCLDNVNALIARDKTGTNALIRMLRAERARRRVGEVKCPNFIICIGSDKEDKKTKELKKHSDVIMLSAPTDTIVRQILEKNGTQANHDSAVKSIRGDLRRLDRAMVYGASYDACSRRHNASQDSREYAAELLRRTPARDKLTGRIPVPDPSLVALLWHENVPLVLCELSNLESLELYTRINKLICIGDIIDRILFHRQLRDSSQLTFSLKCTAGAELLQAVINDNTTSTPDGTELEFTKVLTKYSTAYNNATFIANIAALLNVDYHELFGYFANDGPNVKKMTDTEKNRMNKFVALGLE